MRAPSNLQVWLFCTALLLGLIATVLINASYKNAVEAAAGGNLSPVVIAKRLIEPGTRITEKDIEIKRIPAQHISSRAVPANQQYLLTNKLCSLPVKKGDILTWDAIAQTPLSALSDQLGLMERAVTLNVNEQNSFNGLIKPGDRVDIMHIYDETQPSGNIETKLNVFLQNVSVLAVDGQISRTLALSPESGTNPKAIHTITVKVSPQEAAELAFAQAEGHIAFALRNPSDVFDADVHALQIQKTLKNNTNIPAANSPSQTVSMDAQPYASPPKPLPTSNTLALTEAPPAPLVPELELEPELSKFAPSSFDYRVQEFTQIQN